MHASIVKVENDAPIVLSMTHIKLINLVILHPIICKFLHLILCKIESSANSHFLHSKQASVKMVWKLNCGYIINRCVAAYNMLDSKIRQFLANFKTIACIYKNESDFFQPLIVKINDLTIGFSVFDRGVKILLLIIIVFN